MKVLSYEFEGKKEVKIAHFSDIHYSYKYKISKFNKIINFLKENKPNYICITGDLIDNIEVGENEVLMRTLYQFLTDLGKIAKVIISLGNHDIRQYKDKKNNKWYLSLKKINNIILLDNEVFVENDLCFYGYTAKEEYYHQEKKNLKQLVEGLKKVRFLKQDYNILLIHSPINLDDKLLYEGIKDFDLVLAGHTHNGLMPHFIKGNFGLFAPDHHFWLKNARNSFQNKDIPVVISGGLTKLSYGTGLLHFFDKFYKSDLNYIRVKYIK
ncbi:MAG: metallophosphoesterase [Bacilli bacterium]|nr:metallophosphoesterase [Bacilli bacterium]